MMDEVSNVLDCGPVVEEVNRLKAEVAQLRKRVEHLDALAHQDSLSDLPNRRGFMRALERVIDRVKRYDETSALLFVDLDGLKMINDSFGHNAGDKALIEVAGLLVGGVRKSDVVARIGGDEFGILLAHSDSEKAHEAAQRLVDVIAGRGFTHDGEQLPLSVAIGVTMISPGDSADEVIARADQEMYRRKAEAA